MKRFLIFFLLLCLPLAADDNAAAKKASSAFLALVDAGNYKGAYQASADIVKQSVKEDDFAAQVKAVRDQLGPVKSRKLIQAIPGDQVAKNAPGKFILCKYSTDFANKKGVTELVSPMQGADGTWKVAGYRFQ